MSRGRICELLPLPLGGLLQLPGEIVHPRPAVRDLSVFVRSISVATLTSLLRAERATRRRSLSSLERAGHRRVLRRHLNHAGRRGPALAARLHSRRPPFGGAAERACAMPRKDSPAPPLPGG